jgi:hypothetical protein
MFIHAYAARGLRHPSPSKNQLSSEKDFRPQNWPSKR